MVSKYQFILEEMLSKESFHQIDILSFSKYEFVPFERIFQNVLYFIGITNLEINEEFTNKLDWKKAKKYWNLEIFKSLKNYNPFGPKPVKVQYFSLINRLLPIFEELMPNMEEIRDTNYCLARLVEMIHLILTVRRDDIYKRKLEQYYYIENRNALIDKQKEREKNKQEALIIAKAEFEEKLLNMQDMNDGADNMDMNMNMDHDNKVNNDNVVDMEPEYDEDGNLIIKKDPNVFDEEEWIKNYELNLSVIEIPEEIVPDLDLDIDVKIEDILAEVSGNMQG